MGARRPQRGGRGQILTQRGSWRRGGPREREPVHGAGRAVWWMAMAIVATLVAAIRRQPKSSNKLSRQDEGDEERTGEVAGRLPIGRWALRQDKTAGPTYLVGPIKTPQGVSHFLKI